MSKTNDSTPAPDRSGDGGDADGATGETHPTHVLDVDDLSPDVIRGLLDRAAALKAHPADGGGDATGGNGDATDTGGDPASAEGDATTADGDPASAEGDATTADGDPAGGAVGRPLAGGTVAMLFEKPSTRTRLSFEAGVNDLGGSTVFLGPDETHLGHGEPVRDTARAVSCYADAVVARLFDHDDLATLAAYSSVPVINGLTDRAHPCQALADLLTVREHCGDFDARVAWVGDGNNVAASFALAAAAVDLELTVATPEGYELDQGVLDRAAALGTPPTTTNDPVAAVEGSDVVYTDVWVSMGEKQDRAATVADFEAAGFRVDADLLGDAALMHCLPAHRGEEVTDDALESEGSIVWQQAANRMHVQTALLEHLLG